MIDFILLWTGFGVDEGELMENSLAGLEEGRWVCVDDLFPFSLIRSGRQ